MTGTITISKADYEALSELAIWHDQQGERLRKAGPKQFHAAAARLLRQVLTRLYVDVGRASLPAGCRSDPQIPLAR